jgi:16S rRNA (cytidine1402-2'-O)-methyltransferase
MFVQRSFVDQRSSGTLYLVGTPIGNLEDMTFRAIRILQEVQWIAAEDTRQTRKLLTHYEIKPAKLVSYHEHNKGASGPELIRLLEAGDSIALVSDAGLPAISDPGQDLVRLAVEKHIPTVPIPGANAGLSALIVSGLDTNQFLFVGFLPRNKKGLAEELKRLGKQQATMIFYEAPHRIEKTFHAMMEIWGDRETAVIRELTKKHEEAIRGLMSECLAHIQQYGALGEYCFIVAGAVPGTSEDNEAELVWWGGLTLEEHVSTYIERGMDSKDAIKQTATDRQMSKREVYNQFHRKE